MRRYSHINYHDEYLFAYGIAGGGLFVDMMKRATQSKQFAELDHAVRTKVEPYLYNKGKGKWIPIDKLVLLRNKDRPRHKMVYTNGP